MENIKKIFDLAKKELMDYKSNIAINDVNEIMEKYDNYNVYIGYFDKNGLNYDYQLNDSSDKALMDFDGKSLLDYLINYYNNLDQNLTSVITIEYHDEDDDYYEYYLEYNGYELFSDERW